MLSNIHDSHRSPLFQFNISNNNYYKGFKSVLIALSALAFLLLASSPCPCQGQGLIQDPFLDSLNDPYKQNRTPSKPKIKDKHNFRCAKYFNIGDEHATLPCIATGEPKPEMSWSLLNGSISKILVERQNWSLSIQKEYINCTFRFPPIEKRFQGIYSCKAVSGNDTDFLYFNVKVLDDKRFRKGQPEIFIAFLAMLVFISGVIIMIVKLECCQPKSKLELSAGYKHEGDNGIEEIIMKINPPR